MDKRGIETAESLGSILRDAQPKPVAPRRKPPANPIIGQARADLWDEQLKGLIIDLDTANTKLIAIELRQQVIQTIMMSAVRWNTIRDIILILLAVCILGLIGFNTSQLWGWG